MNSIDQLTLKDLLTVIYKQANDAPQEATKDVPQTSENKTGPKSRKKEKILAEIGHESGTERKTRRVQLLLKESTYNAIKTAADERGTTVNALIGDVIDYLFKE